MNSWKMFLLVFLGLLVHPVFCTDDDHYDGNDNFAKEEIDPDQIGFSISNSSNEAVVTWTIPQANTTDPRCYSTEVQYKIQCVEDWKYGQRIELKQGNEVTGQVKLNTISKKKNYDFRLRMKLWCLQKDWSNWTKVQHWGNNSDACKVDTPSYLWIYIVFIVLPLTAFLLVCLLSQQRLRNLILPDVPDAKHLKNLIIDNDQFEWMGNAMQWNEECTTSDIEIIDTREDHQNPWTIQPVETFLEEQHRLSAVYSAETPRENTELHSYKNVLEYVALRECDMF